MSPDERALYDDVTDYLLSPTLQAFRGNARQLLLLGFHRRMASSIPALAESLDRVASRLRGTLGEADAGETDAAEFVRDLEEEDDVGDGGPQDAVASGWRIRRTNVVRHPLGDAAPHRGALRPRRVDGRRAQGAAGREDWPGRGFDLTDTV